MMKKNIFYCGNLVIAKEKGGVVLLVTCDKKIGSPRFEGVVMRSGCSSWRIGYRVSGVLCGFFEQYKGELMIKDEETIFYQGNLVVSKFDKTVVRVHEKGAGDGMFAGIVVREDEKDKEGCEAGHCSIIWSCKAFEQFEGELVIKKDIFYRGNLVVSKKGCFHKVILVTNYHSIEDKTFSGVVIEAEEDCPWEKGESWEGWGCDRYEQYEGDLVLKEKELLPMSYKGKKFFMPKIQDLQRECLLDKEDRIDIPAEEDDGIFFAGNFVTSKDDDGLVILTDNGQGNINFSGIVGRADELGVYKVGYKSMRWEKKFFKQCDFETAYIKNDFNPNIGDYKWKCQRGNRCCPSKSEINHFHTKIEKCGNIFTEGKLVISNDADKVLVLVTTDETTDKFFTGAVLSTYNDKYKVGRNLTWYAGNGFFRQFNGKITLDFE